MLAADYTVEETGHNLSLEEPIVAKTKEIFDEVDSQILESAKFDQSSTQQNHDTVDQTKLEETLATQPQSSPGVPSPETLRKLQAAVTKNSDENKSLPVGEENAASERPKFGISSLISRMSRSETVNSGSGVGRKEPNFNPEVTDESEFDDLEQEKIEVPAFLRRQAN